jgi:hypothetical protein
MRSRAFLASLCLALPLGCSAAVAAGCDGKPIVEDNFDHPPPGWRSPGPEISAVDGTLQLSPGPGQLLAIPVPWNGATHYDACVTTSFVSGHGIYVALALSASDGGPQLIFRADADGEAAVYRYDPATDQWTVLMPFGSDPAIQSGPGATNRLRLLVEQAQTTFFINDKAMAVVPSSLGVGSSKLEIQTVSEHSGGSVWRIDDMIVTTPEAAMAASQASQSTAPPPDAGGKSFSPPPGGGGASSASGTKPASKPDLVTLFGRPSVWKPASGGLSSADTASYDLAKYQALLNAKTPIKGFSITKLSGNPHPPAGEEEIDYDIRSTSNPAVTGKAVIRFLASKSQADAYFAGEYSPFVQEAMSDWGSLQVHGGVVGDSDQFMSEFMKDEDPEERTHFVWMVDPGAGAERVRTSYQFESEVGFVSLVLPRPGVGADDKPRQATAQAAIEAVFELQHMVASVPIAPSTAAAGSGGTPAVGPRAAATDNGDCQGVVLSDNDFDVVPYGWEKSGTDYAFTDDGKFTERPRRAKATDYYWAIGDTRTFDACVTAAYVGGSGNYLAFGVQQGGNGDRLMLMLWSNGTVDLQRYQPSGVWTSLMPSRVGAVSGVDDGKEFKLAVKVRGNDASFYIDGKLIDTAKGAVPQGDLAVLTQSGSGPDGSSIWSFDDLLVTDGGTVPGAPEVAVRAHGGCTGALQESETFDPATMDPKLLQLGDDYDFSGRHLSMTADDKNAYSYLEWLKDDNQTDPDPSRHNFDFCGSVMLASGPGLFGGLYVEDGAKNTIIQFGVGNDGTAAVARIDAAGGRTTYLIPDRADTAIRAGQGNVNFLHIAIRGNQMTFFVNNQRFGALTDALPVGTLRLGVIGSTGKKTPPAVWTFDDLTLAAPDAGDLTLR